MDEMCICTGKQKIACDLQLCDNIYLEMCISLFIIGPIFAQRYWGGLCCQWLVTLWMICFYNLAQPEITISWKSKVDWWLSPFPEGSSTNTFSNPRLWNLPWRKSTGTWVSCHSILNTCYLLLTLMWSRSLRNTWAGRTQKVISRFFPWFLHPLPPYSLTAHSWLGSGTSGFPGPLPSSHCSFLKAQHHSALLPVTHGHAFPAASRKGPKLFASLWARLYLARTSTWRVSSLFSPLHSPSPESWPQPGPWAFISVISSARTPSCFLLFHETMLWVLTWASLCWVVIT